MFFQRTRFFVCFPDALSFPSISHFLLFSSLFPSFCLLLALLAFLLLNLL